jgi:predicted nucleic acid-binding protein
VGKAALRVFTEHDVQVCIARPNYDEVREYLPAIAREYGLLSELLEAQLRLLSLDIRDAEEYRDRLPEARKLIEKRDPDDVDVVALALKLDLPIWSNDRDFQTTGLRVYTTARLLKALASRRT